MKMFIKRVSFVKQFWSDIIQFLPNIIRHLVLIFRPAYGKKITKQSNNHRIPYFIFCHHFDDKRIINYEWPKASLKLAINFLHDNWLLLFIIIIIIIIILFW